MMNLEIGSRVRLVNHSGICDVLSISGNQMVAKDDKYRFICNVDCVEEIITDTIYDFRALQEKHLSLMELAKERSGLDVVPVNDVIMWLIAEAGEALNEAKFFKYCRKNEVNRGKLLEELTDCLFMFLELSHLITFQDTDYAKYMEEQPGKTPYDNVSDMGMEFAYLMGELALAYRKHDRGDLKACQRKIYDAMVTYVGILNYYKFTMDDITRMYNHKYEINVKRLLSL